MESAASGTFQPRAQLLRPPEGTLRAHLVIVTCILRRCRDQSNLVSKALGLQLLYRHGGIYSRSSTLLKVFAGADSGSPVVHLHERNKRNWYPFLVGYWKGEQERD
jgi:hypothetical protein